MSTPTNDRAAQATARPGGGGWAGQPVLSLDTETTGIDTSTCRIVEIAAALIGPDGTTRRTWHRIVNPGISIPDEAAAIHGITTERAQAEGVDPASMLADLATIITTAGVPVVIYNAAYDWPLLLNEAVRHGIDFPPAWPILDPLIIDKACDRYRKGSRKLVDTAELHGIELGDQAHGALADATASGQLFWALVDKHNLHRHTLTSLHLNHLVWAEEQRASLASWLAKKGETIDRGPGWPLPMAAA